VRGLHRFAVREGLTDDDPTADVKPPRLPRRLPKALDVDQVERLLAAVGHPVQELVRTDIGAVTLGDQRPGSIRVLSRKEVGELYKAVGL